MTRPIKFRAWDKDLKRMMPDPWDQPWDLGATLINNFFVEKDEYIFMQFTWLKDKNWVEIFESDIVKDERWSIYFVKFTAPCFFFEENWTKYIFEQYAMEVHWMEVIGNQFENPELLTK
jgi:hypothetical protein